LAIDLVAETLSIGSGIIGQTEDFLKIFRLVNRCLDVDLIREKTNLNSATISSVVPTEESSGIDRGGSKGSDNFDGDGHVSVCFDESGDSNFVSENCSLLLIDIGVDDASRGVVITNIDIERKSVEDELQRRLVCTAKAGEA
jgi:hypothetical protein